MDQTTFMSQYITVPVIYASFGHTIIARMCSNWYWNYYIRAITLGILISVVIETTSTLI
jgi:hypothetical protein